LTVFYDHDETKKLNQQIFHSTKLIFKILLNNQLIDNKTKLPGLLKYWEHVKTTKKIHDFRTSFSVFEKSKKLLSHHPFSELGSPETI
jgi:hypothetical protein